MQWSTWKLVKNIIWRGQRNPAGSFKIPFRHSLHSSVLLSAALTKPLPHASSSVCSVQSIHCSLSTRILEQEDAGCGVLRQHLVSAPFSLRASIARPRPENRQQVQTATSESNPDLEALLQRFIEYFVCMGKRWKKHGVKDKGQVPENNCTWENLLNVIYSLGMIFSCSLKVCLGWSINRSEAAIMEYLIAEVIINPWKLSGSVVTIHFNFICSWVWMKYCIL